MNWGRLPTTETTFMARQPTGGMVNAGEDPSVGFQWMPPSAFILRPAYRRR